MFGYVAPAFEVSVAVAASDDDEAPAAVRVDGTEAVNVSFKANYGKGLHRLAASRWLDEHDSALECKHHRCG